MKIALLFSGNYSPDIKRNEVPETEQIPIKYLKHAELHFKKYFLDSKYDIDCFIHSWNSEYNDYLIKTYKPKKYIFENLILFKNDQNHINPYYKISPIDCLLAKSYSEKKVIELKQEYEVENNFVYDLCLLIRFDVVWFITPEFEKYLDDNTIYMSLWNNYNNYNCIQNSDVKYLEHIILSNSKTMNEYGTYHDYLQNIDIYNFSSANCIFHIYQLMFLKFKKFKTNHFCFRFHDHCLLRNIFRIMSHNNYNAELVEFLL